MSSELMLTIQAKDEAPPGLTKSTIVSVNIFLIKVYDMIFLNKSFLSTNCFYNILSDIKNYNIKYLDNINTK